MPEIIFTVRAYAGKYFFKVTWNTLKSLVLFIKIRPHAIVTTGTHTAMPMCIIGKLFGAKIIFIETYANVFTPTGSGKFIYKFADRFIVQWEDMLKVYPNATYLGGIF